MGKATKQRRDVHAEITAQIVAAIEAGAGDPKMPWHTAGASTFSPINVASGKPYNGVNIIALWAASEVKGYTSGLWGTYKQWSERGAQVKKGEKASLIVFYKQIKSEAEESQDSEEESVRMFARASTVFNVAQVEGYDELPSHFEQCELEPCERAESIISATGAHINIGGNRAFYRPSTDEITMPDKELFTGTETMSASEAWYATLLHELTHNAVTWIMALMPISA